MTRIMNVYAKFTDMFKYAIKGTYVRRPAHLCARADEACFVSPRTYVPRNFFLLLLFMTLGASSAWGQEDLSGYYYIANNNTNVYALDAATNWYMVPASNGGDGTVSSTAWQWNNSEDTPFVTTYQTKKDDNSIWKIQKNGDYYYIIHHASGKYLTYNSPEYTKRRAFHLQETPDGDNSLFTFTKNGTAYNINRKGLTTGNCWLNTSAGNKPNYYGLTNNTEIEVAGLLGLYNDKDDQGSKWYLEVVPPVISYDASGNIVISNVDDTAVIYYTTDGSTPTSSSTLYTGPITLETGVTIVKAISVINDKATNVSTKACVRLGSGNPYIMQSVEFTDFYMTVGDVSGANTTVNTSSLPQAGMSWHFEDAGINGYYIYNTQAGAYLKSDGTNLYLVTSKDDSDAFKFAILPYYDNGVLSGYNLCNKANNYYVHKANGNSVNNPVYLNANASEKRSRWNIISESAKAFPSYVNTSTSSDVHYYTFASSAATDYLITAPSSTTAYVNTTSTVSDNQKWLFQEAGTDGWATYYYIVSAATGNALYFTKNEATSNQTDALQTKSLSEKDVSNEDRYKFALARTIVDGEFYIIPKPLGQYAKTNYTAIWRENANALQSRTSRNDNKIKWKVTAVADFIAPPIITYDPASNTVTLSCTTPGVTYRYTDDGNPATTSSTLMESAPFSFTPAAGVTTIRVISCKGGLTSQETTYTIPVQTTVGDTQANLRPYLIQSQNNAWTTGDHQGYHYYMVPGDNGQLNTTSMLRSTMEWYFKYAGAGNGYTYYYIVNKANGLYICYDTNIYLRAYSSSDDNKYKFRIQQYPMTGTATDYNIVPYGLSSGNMYLNKGNNNNNSAAINLANNNSIGNSRWKFVTKSALDVTPPFVVSDGSSTIYYQLRSYGDEYYIKAPASATANATMVAAASAENDTYWYLEQAAAATDADWLTYYYIRNAQTGDYLYYANDNPSNNNAAFKTSAALGEAARYQFAYAHSTTADYYFIVPKMLRDETLNNISTLNRNNTQLRVQKVRATGTSAWTFVTTAFCNPPVITQDTETRAITITCSSSGATIYYTTDGTEPVVPIGESTTQTYTASFTPRDGVDQIQAFAVNGDGTSTIVTYTLPKFTYKIVNRSNVIAATSEVLQQAAGKALSGYTSIPESIRSSYLADETVTFYTMEDDFDAANLDAEHRITATPASSATIYVTYTTTHLSEKFLPLTNAAPYNVKEGSNYLFANSGTLDKKNSPADAATKTNAYLWYFLGSDPYDVTVQNVGKSNYLNYTSPTLSLNTAQTFILKNLTDSDASSRNVTLRNASGEEVTLTVNTVVLPLSFTLIDKAGKIIESNINYESSFALPAAWQSPLVSQYKFYKKYTSLTDGVYTFDEADRIYSVENREDNVIYVTYDVNDDLDLDGGFNRESGGKTYMLEFANGVPFYQENGSDGLMETTLKPIYPYSNGDATLYIYGSDRWNTQLANGATTRTRWLWYLEPALKVDGEYVLDPYHVRISSYQNQTNYTDPATKVIQANFHSYLRTYKPEGYSAVVTGTTNNNPLTNGLEASATALTGDELPAGTEYMLIGTSLNSLKLVTAKAISDGSTTERRTVTSFEQYWKNSPTVQNKLTNKVTRVGRNVTLSDTQKTEVEAMTMNGDNLGWHVYADWANSAPWLHNNDATSGGSPTTSKKFLNEEHVFQTINMGDGSFRFAETELTPMLILLDLHGWEIMRLPLTAAKEADRKKYNSPMVQEYHWYATGSKVPGYHKFTVSGDPQYTTTTLDFTPEDGTDFYVTYTVKPEYARTYSGAATKAGTSASRFLVKQGDNYAKISGTSLSAEPAPLPEAIGDELQWYLRPNFDIDREMGYLYAGETGAQEEALSQENTEIQNHSEGRNGFDPYNLQIQSVANVNRYFTADTKDSEVGSTWSGETTEITLENMAVRQSDIIGLDQVKMNITNATFMVVADANGRMVLMPRFDHTKVVNSLTGSQLAATGTNTYSLTVSPVPTVVNRSSEIQAMGGTYVLSSSFTVDETIGTADAPFQGTIDGQMITISSLTTPFIEIGRAHV